jgi:hypothetical protein
MTTKITSTAIVNSTVDSTVIGAITPANATVNALIVNGFLTGPVGSVLTIRPGGAGNANIVDIQNFAGTVNYFLVDINGVITIGPGPVNLNGTLNASAISVSGGITTAGLTVNISASIAALTVSGNTTTASLIANIQAQAPTVAAADSSTNVATTAWVRLGFAASFAANGYFKFPTWLGGLILQWGYNNAAASSMSVSFPTAFTNCYHVHCMPTNYGPNAGRDSQYLTAVSATAFTVGCGGSTIAALWFAIGN